jgi:hypothetical protein
MTAPPARLVADTLTVFVPARLVNPLNGSHGHWSGSAKRVKLHRDATAAAVWAALRDPRAGVHWHITAKPSTPKVVTFTLYVGRRFDSDATGAICKPFRDALQDVGLVHSDGPDSGHTFEPPTQLVDRTRRGVEITVRLRD